MRFTAAMLFSVGGVAMFVIGGLSGVTHAIVPADYQQTDTYYIVAHFHYVIFGGAVFGIFSAAYYWWPKVFGQLLSEGIGKLHFWLMIIGFNLAFGPMHVLGLQGMIRREYTYPESLGLTFWNQVATLGAFLIAVSVLVFIVNVVKTRMQHRPLEIERSVGRAHAGVDDVVAASRAQLRRDPDGALARRVLASEVRGGQERQARAGPGGGGRSRPTSARRPRTRSTCRARRTGRSSRRSGCRSWRTA